MKHVMHVNDGAGVPCRDVRVEPLTVLKHVLHVVHRASVPCRDVRVERCRIIKHVVHVLHGARVPCRDICVERFRFSKHAVHVRHRASVPQGDVCVRKPLSPHENMRYMLVTELTSQRAHVTGLTRRVATKACGHGMVKLVSAGVCGGRGCMWHRRVRCLLRVGWFLCFSVT